MPSTPSSLDLLLAELEDDIVVPERYSRRSLYGRYEPLIATTVLAFVAIIGAMLVCELTREPA